MPRTTQQPTQPTEPEMIDITEQSQVTAIENELYISSFVCTSRHNENTPPITSITSFNETVDGQVCVSCFDNYYQPCENCNENFDKETLTRTNNDTYFCEDCEGNYTFQCINCKDTFERNDSYHVESNEEWCERCHENCFISCNNCEESVHEDNVSFCEECEKDFCESCYEEHSHDNRANAYREVIIEPIRGNIEKAELIKSNRLVGIELEAESGNVTALSEVLPRFIGISHDGSLGDDGIEIQTPPASADKLEELIKTACKELKTSGYKAHQSCGLHVHLDASDFKNDHKKIVQIIKTFYSCEDILYSMLPPSRWNNHYCQRLVNNFLYNAFKQKISKQKLETEWYKEDNIVIKDQRKKKKYDNTRYYGLNIHSIFYRGTVEFRYHSGTLEAHKIIHWINLMLLMLEYALTRYNDIEIKKMFGFSTSYNKFAYFCKIFKVNFNLQSYMENRTNKFNRYYKVQFNKGKKVRQLERKRISSAKKAIEKKIKEKMTEAKEKVTDGHWYKDSNEKEKEEAIKNLARNLAFKELPLTYQKLPIDGGFATEDELLGIIDYIQQGIDLARENNREASSDEEG